jgi:hypothetical protein
VGDQEDGHVYLFAFTPWAQWLRDGDTKVIDGVPRGDERAHGVKIAAENMASLHTSFGRSEYIIAVQSGLDLCYLNSHTGSWCSNSHLSVGTIETGESFQPKSLHKKNTS